MPEMDPDAEKMKAAVAAMWKDWRKVRPLVNKAPDPAWDEEECAEAQVERARLMGEFFQRHEAVLKNPDSPLPKEVLAELGRKETEMRAAFAKIEATEEKLLHATADLAESEAALVEATLATLAGLEALTPEDWAQMEEGQRGKTLDVLLMLREERPSLLAELTAERRQFWEKG